MLALDDFSRFAGGTAIQVLPTGKIPFGYSEYYLLGNAFQLLRAVNNAFQLLRAVNNAFQLLPPGWENCLSGTACWKTAFPVFIYVALSSQRQSLLQVTRHVLQATEVKWEWNRKTVQCFQMNSVVAEEFNLDSEGP